MTRSRFAAYAWIVLGFNLLVILWGSVVRATGSGAGCGSDWPRCDGAVAPTLEDSETAIEFIHRFTSALAFIAVIVLFFMARRLFESGHRVCRAAGAAVVFIAIEAIIGAALVIFGWVEDDTSIGRIITIAVHLGNTFLLLGTLTAAAWWGSGRPGPHPDRDRRTENLLGIGLVALIVIGGLGAITALGDTLFPPGEAADESARAQFLVNLRVIHPILAVATGVYLMLVGRFLASAAQEVIRRLAAAVTVIVAVQIAAGVFTILLMAPLWMQLLHLTLADVLWIATVLLTLSAMAEPVEWVERVPSSQTSLDRA